MSRELIRLSLVTAPAVLPVGLNEAKKQIEIDDSDTSHDAFITGLIEAATDEAEKFTGRSLIARTYQGFWDRWPADPSKAIWWEGIRQGPESLLGEAKRDFELPHPPLISLTHIKTYDDSDAATTFDASNYFVDTVTEPGRIVLRTSSTAPVIERVANGLEVQFVAGYGSNPADVPEAIRHGILMTAAWLFTNRGECDEAAKNSGANTIWRKYRMLRVM